MLNQYGLFVLERLIVYRLWIIVQSNVRAVDNLPSKYVKILARTFDRCVMTAVDQSYKFADSDPMTLCGCSHALIVLDSTELI